MNALNISAERLEHLRHLEAHLCEQIRGQDHVIPRIVAALHRGELGLTSSTRPRGSFLFLGPTGVGKTETTIAFTDYLLGGEKLFRFDMSEYQTQESVAVLIGGQVGEVGLLGLTRAKSGTGTLLFDVRQRKWSAEMLDRTELDASLLAQVYESQEVAGRVSAAGAAATGLRAGTPVVAGAGDQAAGAVGAPRGRVRAHAAAQAMME